MSHTFMSGAVAAALLLAGGAAQAADHLSAQQVRAALSGMPNGKADLHGKDMSGDDLTGRTSPAPILPMPT